MNNAFKYYYIESGNRWFIVECRNKRVAMREGRKELNRVKTLRIATAEEVADYSRQREIETFDN